MACLGNEMHPLAVDSSSKNPIFIAHNNNNNNSSFNDKVMATVENGKSIGSGATSAFSATAMTSAASTTSNGRKASIKTRIQPSSTEIEESSNDSSSATTCIGGSGGGGRGGEASTSTNNNRLLSGSTTPVVTTVTANSSRHVNNDSSEAIHGAESGDSSSSPANFAAGATDETAQFEADKRLIYKHPLFPLLALLFEKCEMATQSSECPSAETFNLDIQAFIQHQERDGKPFFTDNHEVNDLMIKAIQVLRIHLLELEKVQELCKDFCSRYITCLKGKMQSENLLRSDYGGYDSDDSSGRASVSGSLPLGHHAHHGHHLPASSASAAAAAAAAAMIPSTSNSSHSQAAAAIAAAAAHGFPTSHMHGLMHPHHPHHPHAAALMGSPAAAGMSGSTHPTSAAAAGAAAAAAAYFHHPAMHHNADAANRAPYSSGIVLAHSNTSNHHNNHHHLQPQERQLEHPSGQAQQLQDIGRNYVSVPSFSNPAWHHQLCYHQSRVCDPMSTTSVRKSGKNRTVLPREATRILKTWLFKNVQHPYPSECEKRSLSLQSDLTLVQVNNWFINARRRLLQPDRNFKSSKGTIRSDCSGQFEQHKDSTVQTFY